MGRFILGVHIADVSALIKPGMALDAEAMERATSIYMPDRRIPMLPEILSDEWSQPERSRNQTGFLVFWAELDEAGRVHHHEFFPSMLAVRSQLSYQGSRTPPWDTDRILGKMWKLSQALKARRVEQGALILPLPKTQCLHNSGR